MTRIQIDWEHDYLLEGWEYPISDNNRPATYDQFITLRDTLIRSKKYYADKAWRSLIIGTKLDGTPTDTIEIREPNLSRMSFEPWYENDPNLISNESQWTYVTVWHTGSTNPLCCEIQKDGRYRIAHKQQFVNIDSSITRIHCYVNHHPAWWWADIPRAVFDWEWADGGFFNRMTTYGYVECDLHKWDWLELKMLDQNDDPIDSSTWRLGQDANWWMVEYIDLAYNK